MSMTMGQLASKMHQTARQIEPKAERELARLAQVGVGLVKREIQNSNAVDTSAMLNSTTAEKTGTLTWLIGPTVDYAVYVALGTSRMPARPFHTKAAKRLRSQLDDFDLGL